MSEGNDIAYLELWRDRTGARSATLTVCFNGSRRWDAQPTWDSAQVVDWLTSEGFVFHSLLPPHRTGTPAEKSATSKSVFA